MDFHTKSYKSPDPEIPIQSLYIYVCINCVAQTVSLGCLCLYQWFVWQATHPVNTTNCMNEGRYLSVIIHLNQDLLSFIQSALISKYIYMYMKKLLDSDWQRTVASTFYSVQLQLQEIQFDWPRIIAIQNKAIMRNKKVV